MTARFAPAPPGKELRDAATVMLVRDAPAGDGVEVFMVRRTMGAAFAGGFYVFPGGTVDEADRSAGMAAITRGRDDAAASAVLGLEAGGLAFWVAAVRECFEEAGVLLAATSAGEAVCFDDPAVHERFAGARRQVHAGTLTLVELCAAEGLLLTTDAIEYVAHWITPAAETRRFDTRFFVARAPKAQEPLHDAAETIESLWVHPADALARHEHAELGLMPPTIANLRFLAEHADADAVLAAARALPRPPAILPKLRRGRDGKVGVVLPGDPDYASTPDRGA